MYIDNVMFPKGRATITALTNVSQVILAASLGRIKITHLIISGGVAAESVIFTSADGVTEYFRISVPAGDTAIVPGFDCPATGLAAITSSAAGDVDVATFYVTV